MVSSCIVCCAEKKEQLFWLSSLVQMVQFETLRGTFRNYFGQFVWIEKIHWYSPFHFMKRRLKNGTYNYFVLPNCQIFVNKHFKTTLNAEIQLVNHSIRQHFFHTFECQRTFAHQKCEQNDW